MRSTSGASDLHFEPYEKTYRVRFRIDGILKEVASPPVQLAQKISARIKVMSRLDIAERRVPQDGRIKMKLSKTARSTSASAPARRCSAKRSCCASSTPIVGAKLGIDALGYEGRPETSCTSKASPNPTA
jgi:type IV pilus assembly protein PilB